MINLKIKSNGIIITPLTTEEIKKLKNRFALIYVLYKNEETDEIEIGIPDMERYSSLANMYGFESAKEKAYFANVLRLTKDLSQITDRPVYMIKPTERRTIGDYTIINDVNIDLNDVISGDYIIGMKQKNKHINMKTMKR